jgi:hypothetical protein
LLTLAAIGHWHWHWYALAMPLASVSWQQQSAVRVAVAVANSQGAAHKNIGHLRGGWVGQRPKMAGSDILLTFLLFSNSPRETPENAIKKIDDRFFVDIFVKKLFGMDFLCKALCGGLFFAPLAR